eukprot:sb/3478311/
MPDDPGSDHSYGSTPSKRKDPRKVLGERAVEQNKKGVQGKSWGNKMESRTTPRSVSVTESVSSVKDTKRKRRDVVGERELKKIVKEEMNAIVTMQNDIWHI